MYDVIVIGVGGMGSATVYHLARSGCKVLGLEQFGVPHAFGSSHGSTRIIRMAYSEGPEYVPLLRAAYQYWREIEDIAGTSLLRVAGGLDIGSETSWTIKGSRKSCLENGLEFEELDSGGVNRTFPGYRLPASLRAIYQPDGGYVLSEVAIEAYVAAARVLGAEIVTNSQVRGWERHAAGLRVDTKGGHYEAKRLVITAGPWVGKLLHDLQAVCRPERQVMLWTEPIQKTVFEPEQFPVFNMEAPSGRYYGFPNDRGEGFKIGKYYHLRQQIDNPDRLDRACHPEDEAVLREAIKEYFPEANGLTRKMAACMFTNSPDGHFILDRYPGYRDVFVATGFSGHGFKFCSVIGKIMTEFCLDQPPSWEVRRFGLERLQVAGASLGIDSKRRELA